MTSGHVLHSGWLRKSPPEEKLRLFVSAGSGGGTRSAAEGLGAPGGVWGRRPGSTGGAVGGGDLSTSAFEGHSPPARDRVRVCVGCVPSPRELIPGLGTLLP